jgi:polysaccharide pyruvyl transferase WcaK-like protein
MRNADIFDPISDSRILVINGEGSIHGASNATRTILYIAYVVRRYMRKNVQIINHSCFPERTLELTDPLQIALYKGVYEHLDFVAFREHLSARLMSRLGIQSTLGFDCLPLTIRNDYPDCPERQANRLIVSGSIAFDEERIRDFSQYIRHMGNNGYRAGFLIGARSYPAPDEEKFAARLQGELGGQLEIIRADSLKAWLDCIAGAGLFVSGRFHHTIAAIMLGTPFVLLESNTPKNRALMETVGMQPPLQYTAGSFENDLMKRTHQALASQGIASATLDEICARADRNFDGLRALS